MDNSSNNPHVTLYHGAYEKEDLNKIYDKIKKLNIKPFTLNFIKIYATSNRWIDWDIEKSEYLNNFHRKLVKLASPYHKRPLKRAADIYQGASYEVRHQIDQYGVSGVLELYKPHLTLFYQYPANSALQKAAEDVANNFKSNIIFKAVKMTIGELGYNGNIIKILYNVSI